MPPPTRTPAEARLALTRALLGSIPIATLAFVPLDVIVGAAQTPGLIAARLILVLGFGIAAWRLPTLGPRAQAAMFLGLSLALSVAMALLCQGTGGVTSPAFGFLWALPLIVGLLFMNQPACPLVSGVSSLPLGGWLLIAGGKSNAEIAYWLGVTVVATALAATASVLYRRLQRLERAQESDTARALAHHERLASLGSLAAGMAHEINTPLACTVAYHGMLAEKLAGDAEATEWLHDAQLATARMDAMVKDLLLFSRAEKGPQQAGAACNLKDEIERSLALARTQLVGQSAEVVTAFATVPAVRGPAVRIGQVFLNLVVNAAQAMPRTRTHNRIQIQTAVGADGRVVTEVRDNGSGIPSDVLPRIFEPFFTTKEAGVGTGLGLSICHRIVRDLGGDIEVESELGKGTTFRVFLRAA